MSRIKKPTYKALQKPNHVPTRGKGFGVFAANKLRMDTTGFPGADALGNFEYLPNADKALGFLQGEFPGERFFVNLVK